MSNVKSYAALKKRIRTARTYFELFGVHAGSTTAALKAVHRSMAGELHPDRNGDPDAGALMALVNVAYDTLVDEAPRQLYLASLGGRSCEACKGRGYNVRTRGFTATIETACSACAGSGRVLKSKE